MGLFQFSGVAAWIFYTEVTVILDELLFYVMTLNWQHVSIAKRS